MWDYPSSGWWFNIFNIEKWSGTWSSCIFNQLGSSSQDGNFEESANVFVLKLKVYNPFLDIPLRKRVVKKNVPVTGASGFVSLIYYMEKFHKVAFRQWWNFSNPPAINMFIPFAYQSGSILITIYITMNMVEIQILNKSWLVVWNMNFIVPFSWDCHHPNWRTHMFQRGRYTTNQRYYFYVGIKFGFNHWIIQVTN